MSYYKKIAGERLYLSPINREQGNEETYVKWMNDKSVTLTFGQYDRAISSADDLKWIYETSDTTQCYAIVLLDGDVMIGNVSLHNIDHISRNAFLGVFIGEEEHRGKGYGTEAIRLLLSFAFKTLNLHNIMLTVHADNQAGIACYKKAGFREAGRLREWEFKEGRYVDRLYMDVLEGELA